MRKLKKISKEIDGIHQYDCTCALCIADYTGQRPDSHWCGDQHKKEAHRIGLKYNSNLIPKLKNQTMQEKAVIILTDHEIRLQKLEGNKNNPINLPEPGKTLEIKTEISPIEIQTLTGNLLKKEEDVKKESPQELRLKLENEEKIKRLADENEMLRKQKQEDDQKLIQLTIENSVKEGKKELAMNNSIIQLIKLPIIPRVALEKAGATFDNWNNLAYLNGVRFKCHFLKVSEFWVLQGVK
jgi:hypothetical protein